MTCGQVVFVSSVSEELNHNLNTETISITSANVPKQPICPYFYGSFITLHSYLSASFHDGSNIFLLDLFYAQYAERNILIHLTSTREAGKSHPGKISQSIFLVVRCFFFQTVAVSITTFERRTASKHF